MTFLFLMPAFFPVFSRAIFTASVFSSLIRFLAAFTWPEATFFFSLSAFCASFCSFLAAFLISFASFAAARFASFAAFAASALECVLVTFTAAPSPAFAFPGLALFPLPPFVTFSTFGPFDWSANFFTPPMDITLPAKSEARHLSHSIKKTGVRTGS